MKDVDLGEPTSFLDHVYLGCTERECQICKDFVDNHRNVFESRISAGSMEKLSVSENSDANISSWSRDVEGQAKKCVERYCELANVGEVSKVCAQIVLKCLYLARIWRLDFFLVRKQTCPCSHTMDESLLTNV